MADNVTLNAGTGGAVAAADDIGSVFYQRVKLSVGADGTAVDAIPVSNGLDTTATGVQAVGIVGQLDDTGTGAVTENQFAPVRISTRRALLVEGVASGTAVPISVATIPSHAVTNAGTFAVQADSVIPGVAATSLGKAEDAAHTSGDVGVMALAVRNDAGTALAGTTGDYIPLSTDNTGALRVVGSSGTTQYTEDGASAGAESLCLVGAVRRDSAASSGGTDGDYVTLNTNATGALRVTVDSATSSSIKAEDAASADGDNLAIVGTVRRDTAAVGSGTDGDYSTLNVDSTGRLWCNVSNTVTVAAHAVTNAGTFAVQADSVIPGVAATSLGKAEDAAHSSGDTGVMMLGVRAAAPTERSAGPTDGDYEPLGINEVGAVWTTPTPSVNGGLSTFMASGSDGSSILVATAQAIKASAGALFGYYAYNPEAAVTFVHFYNTAAGSVTVGTTNPLFTIAIPATSGANLALPFGITFSNAGWSCAATTTAGGNTAPATGVSLVAWYK